MASRIDDLLQRIATLEHELEDEFARVHHRWRYRIAAGRVRFERDARLAHRRLRQSIPRFIRESSPLNLVTALVIYSLIVPIALTDLWVTVYQRLCFPIYGIALVRRSAFIVINRHHHFDHRRNLLEKDPARLRAWHGYSGQRMTSRPARIAPAMATTTPPVTRRNGAVPSTIARVAFRKQLTITPTAIAAAATAGAI
jgi:hypothetical protein